MCRDSNEVQSTSSGFPGTELDGGRVSSDVLFLHSSPWTGLSGEVEVEQSSVSRASRREKLERSTAVIQACFRQTALV
jgi:hypothetical protein